MKKMKSKRNFVVAVSSTILAFVCIVEWFFLKPEWRFLVSAILLLAIAATNYSIAFSRKGVCAQLEQQADERDREIVLKSSHMALKIINYVLCIGCFISLFLYAAVPSSIIITVTVVLCTVLVILFAVMLGANLYYEKHN